MIRLLPLVVGLMSLGCSESKFSCDDERQGDWAIRIFEDPDEHGQCAQDGSVVFEDGSKTPLICEIEGADCVCRAGTDFGVYEIFMQDVTSGETVRAVMEVEAVPSPNCVTRRTIETFKPVHLPAPQGGAGGADN